MRSPLPGVQVDDAMNAYADDSRHRQKLDSARIVEAVAPELAGARTVVDLGCGVGDLIAQLRDRVPTAAAVTGVDASELRVDGCTQRFASDPRCRFVVHDLLDPLPFHDADVVTMTAVLHWLHPHESRVIAGVAERMSPHGAFALTSYHPEPEIAGLGGTDAVVAAAVGTPDDVLDRFASTTVTPVSHRTLPADDLAAEMARHFGRIDRTDALARTAPATGTEFASYFMSTFGTYYQPLFGSSADMRERIAIAAERRLTQLGHVTSMTVSTWVLREPVAANRTATESNR